MRAYGAKSLEEEKRAVLQMCARITQEKIEVRRARKVELMNNELCEAGSPEVLDDEEVALACVRFDGWLLPAFSKRLQDQREIVLTVVKKEGSALACASEGLRGDREVVLAAVSKDGSALRSASEELRGDKEIALAAVNNAGYALEFASEELRGDKEVVLAAVTNEGQALEHANQELRGNREVVLAAVGNEDKAFRYASEELINDKDFVLLVARCVWEKNPGTCYQKAGSKLKEELTEPDFRFAVESALAVSGQPQPAPMLLVTSLTRCSASSVSRDGGSLQVVARLGLSGEELQSELLIEPDRVDDLSLNDLAKELIATLKRSGKMNEQQKRIFVSFLTSETNDPLTVTPWDARSPLGHFLSAKP